ncbi:1-acyl-sn-glycerol-3-phosphate acyltransferase [Nakamurella flavida]|uniref:1-acyl-sn-glycerol-3-phosphate acyltransferase n=1 Tax=Nakamurella flavida TaxID=363630 RepID=A0A939C2N7_9ACTN|nr:lysophospholipid acyltransferase family protein [Nakamurella flavida]MBM9476206.1 1-acyl-sn-glycerol-3-phosphate acyltransferase [Nakamurella flavida]MDP9779696.1 1-acyl-sn-glycerol-3-phosphate acyltransferase [Nakamurella flavida]
MDQLPPPPEPSSGPAERSSRTYRIVVACARPIVRGWGRLTVEGLDVLPGSGPVVIFANHDSMWDPLTIAVAAGHRRQIRALAKASLWRIPVLAQVLDGMGQIPVRRGQKDASAMDAAVQVLTDGGCIGIFPEGTVTHGRILRARSGAGRLVLGEPASRIVCATVEGTTDMVAFPRRPRLRVRFFSPTGGGPRPGEDAVELSTRILAELRAEVPARASRRRHRRPLPVGVPGDRPGTPPGHPEG